jgi:hypothetical protein
MVEPKTSIAQALHAPAKKVTEYFHPSLSLFDISSPCLLFKHRFLF